VDFTVYLPDGLGERAKAELERGVLSRLLRDAVQGELERRDAVSNTLAPDEIKEHLLDFLDDDDNVTTGRLRGVQITEENNRGESVFLTEDERVILYDSERLAYWEVDDPENELEDRLPQGDYARVMHALGIKPIIDI